MENTRRASPTRQPDDVAMEVVNAVAQATDTDIMDLPVLEYSIDGDSLNQAIHSMESHGTITFEYADCMVLITEDGTVKLDAPATATSTTILASDKFHSAH